METNQWIKSVKLVCVMLITVPLLTGCWDQLEIDERAVVLGVSIDVAGEDAEQEESEVGHVQGAVPAPRSGMVRVGVQIALPGRIPLGPGEGGGSQEDSQQTVWVIEVVGHSINDAFMNLQQQISSKLFFGHLRVIVISEALAKKGLENVNDYFRRNSEVRRMAWMMISKGHAMGLMRAAPKLERMPTLYLMSTLDEGINLGRFPKDYLGIFWSNTSKKGQEGFLPYVEMKKEQNVEIMGLAYFKNNRMVGVTKPLEIAGYLGLKGVNPAGYSAVINLEGMDESVMTNVTQRGSKFDLQIKNGLPHFTIDVNLEVNLEEKMNDEQLIDNTETIKSIDRKQEEVSEKFYKDIIRKTQEKGSDIFGFGEYVRAKKPGYWNKRIKTKENWQRMYKDATFDVNVTVNVRRIGMKAK
ncbi:Ger(x)C family spore germination protein [Paenibacillus alkaliterrae]|uniref:Ger(x)C family spore germination protein n=1 Tax=Paenibacillus alkaliterrae TaxID=320909 RepID=UPI001F21248A|nr:Ger(x)C family spore germination protein [Paenibacillus alkaliterrae]MCF2936933.1 Ger(x)C family spore germination protein [Paenibacillus alkaliterrae]